MFQLAVGANVLTQEQRQTLLKALKSQLPCNGALLNYFNIDVNLIGSGGAMTAWPEAWGAVDNSKTNLFGTRNTGHDPK